MCPHGYHHNGFMTTPALGTQEVRYKESTLFLGVIHCRLEFVMEHKTNALEIWNYA